MTPENTRAPFPSDSSKLAAASPLPVPKDLGLSKPYDKCAGTDSARTGASIVSSPKPERPRRPSFGRRWEARNTSNLGLRVCGDMTAAGFAGLTVAPVVAAIDRAIIENASNRNTISGSVLNSLRSLAVAPHRFIFSRPFALVFILYSSTYLAANGLDTASSTFAMEPTSTPESEQRKRTHLQNSRDPAYTTSGTPKFLATSITNLSLCVYKDSQFAKYFGAPTSTRPVPPMSLLLFGARDALTIFASFNLPAIIAPRMSLAGIGLQNIDQAWENHVSRASAAQFLAPAAVQVFSTPLHLLGLDLYNRQDGYVSRVSRFHKIWSDWGKSCMARVCRIVPAFGVGGVVNTNVRREWMRKLPSQHI